MENKLPPYHFSHLEVDERLKRRKYKITDKLTEELIKSLTTKIVYTLSHYGVLSEYKGTVDCEVFTVTPYSSVLGDTRFIIELNGLQDTPFMIVWNGKFSIRRKSPHSGIFVTEKDFNVQNCLDSFVAFEQKVVNVLHQIEEHFFEAVPVNQHRPVVVEETPVMHAHVDEE